MLLKLVYSDHEEPFTIGAAKYRYTAANPGDEVEGRLTIKVEIEGLRTEAVVDTAADWSVCHPEVADTIDLTGVPQLVKDMGYNVRGYKWRGDLYSMNLCLVAQEGRSFCLEASVFVPYPVYWRQVRGVLPRSFLGLRGGLERMRFAFDPTNDFFFFGQAG